MTFYHVRAQNHVTLTLIKTGLNRQMWVYFNAIWSVINRFVVNNVKSVNFVNLDQLQWVNFAACTQRPVMITGDVSHGSPFIKPI